MVLLGAGLFLFGPHALASTDGRETSPNASGWGIEAILATRSEPFGVSAYLDLLESSGIRWLREREPGTVISSSTIPYETARRKAWRQQKERGFHVLAWWGTLNELPVAHHWNKLPENLLDLYRDALLLGEYVTEPAAWEIFNEADAFFLPDPAERVAAAQKAIYLGIKDGARRRTNDLPIVLMGSLAHAPTPWLERMAANEHFEYTDGLNIHFYGHARDFQNFVRVQRDFAQSHVKDRALPIWVTECGIDGLPSDDYDNAGARQLQADFTLKTAKVAVEEKIAVFMPFLLVAAEHRTGGVGGHDMVKNPTEHYPAWEVYRDFTNGNSLENLPVSLPPENPGRIVVQWLPDYSTCVPHKVSGAYWSERGQNSLAGEVVIYNFSSQPVSGRLTQMVSAPASVQIVGDAAESLIEVPPLARVQVPVTFTVPEMEFYRSDVRFEFIPANPDLDPSHKPSWVVFAIESRPSGQILNERAEVAATRPDTQSDPREFSLAWPDQPFKITSASGPWIGVNGALVAPIDRESSGEDHASKDGILSAGWSFAVEQTPDGINPKTSPPVAITRVNGLPELANGYLRLRMPGVFGRDGSFRVDLIDEEGQRFAIAENFGDNRFSPTPGELLLAYRDFHLYAWGRVTSNYKLDPNKVREIQLRLFMTPNQSPMEVRIDVAGTDRAN
jgi:hypothetical protein